MKTETELRTEVFNALDGNVNIPAVFWKANPPSNATYPSVWYSRLETIGDYVFTTHLNSETIQFQVDVRTDPNDITNMDLLVQEVKDTMHTLNYFNINSPNELFDSEINKNVRVTRWEIQNV